MLLDPWLGATVIIEFSELFNKNEPVLGTLI